MFKNAVEIFDIFGFRVRVDPSWLLIAALVVWSLSAHYFPSVVGGLSQFGYLALGVVAMLGLFASLLLHELAHSLMARQFGLSVGNITLFIFGGVAELEHEPQSPKSEFWIAIVGPVMSFVIAGVSAGVSIFLQGLDVSKPLQAVFNYLAVVNTVIAVFNLVPAFPLDGGRMFRAILWHFRGDVFSATKIASFFGTVFGYFLVASGVLAFFSAGVVAGLWQILIGFFIVTASRGSYEALLMSASLKDQKVRSLMTTATVTSDVDTTIQSLIDDVFLKHKVTFVPVVEGDRLFGYVSTALLQSIDRADWATTKLSDVYVASGPDNTVSPDALVEDVFEKMATSRNRKLLVADEGKLVGIIALSDLMTYLAIRNGLGLQTLERTRAG